MKSGRTVLEAKRLGVFSCLPAPPLVPGRSAHEVAQTLMAHHIHRFVVVEPEGEKLRPLAVVSDGDLIYHLGKDK